MNKVYRIKIQVIYQVASDYKYMQLQIKQLL